MILTLIFGLTAFANAQNVNLSGRIFDLNGAVIAGMKIVAISQAKVKYEQRTDGEGIYLLNLPPGVYKFEINKQSIKYNSFEFLRFKNFRVVPSYDRKMNLDFSLNLNPEKKRTKKLKKGVLQL